MASATDGGVETEPAVPQYLTGGENQDDPERLDLQHWHNDGGVVDPPRQQRDRKIHLVEVGQAGRETEERGRQQVERENLAAEHRLERHREDDQSLDLEKPEAEQ